MRAGEWYFTHLDAGEAQSSNPSVSNQALYHWATVLPIFGKSVQKSWVKAQSCTQCKTVPFEDFFDEEDLLLDLAIKT